ncbi:two pore domain potassium channel family protein [Thalassomonas viridans]|uniref:Two pore domain potassium channel family protein n=1 Tax=Thalassomonas viridans TaxID=137584 RepID=A0AAE9Z0D4_9GAMM|nr:potassium channel family protein [Thalassomonas viridans]WDE04233.1 two pore domain potassium channel family protein [Thalassomonas viridans]
MNSKLTPYTVDEFGVKNYHSGYLLLITLAALYAIIAALSFLLLHFEAGAANSNITTYKDAFWTLQMSASTIGFGDYYPVTLEGRIVVGAMFYIGVGMVGFIGAQFIDRFVGFSDTNVKNRELRKQNAEILEHNQQLEKKIDMLAEKIEAMVASQSK